MLRGALKTYNTINKELAPVKKGILKLQALINFHTEEFGKLQNEQAATKNNTKCLKKENEHIQNAVSILNTRINLFEQYA